MAEVITVRGVGLKRRSPWGVWALNLLTLGCYGIVYWQRINTELRDYTAAVGRPLRNDPARSALALAAGSLVIIPGLVTIASTTDRIRRVQRMTASFGSAVIEVRRSRSIPLAILGGLHFVYLQSALNDCWERAAELEASPPRLRVVLEPVSAG
jgi:hypothetical protein